MFKVLWDKNIIFLSVVFLLLQLVNINDTQKYFYNSCACCHGCKGTIPDIGFVEYRLPI